MPIQSTINYDVIPNEITRHAQWVVWRYDLKPDKSETTKVPYTDIYHRAKPNDPKTWRTFNEARILYEANTNGWGGIGYEFVKAQGSDGMYIIGLDGSHA
jgi:putative DNA primase/helicase